MVDAAKKDDEEQAERFKRTARELGADESEERFNERLKRIAKVKPKARRKGKQDGSKGQ